MNTISRNILAVVAGLVVGSVLNMMIIMVSGYIVPPPAGVELSDAESMKSSMHLFAPINFLMPFLAHAIGTFVGALLAALIAGSHKMLFALVIAGFFLIGGAMMVFMLSSPLWFSIVDLVFAYFPMAWLGGKLAIWKV